MTRSGVLLTNFQTPRSSSKNTPLRVVFSNLFLVFGNVVKHGLLCLIYYMERDRLD